MLSLRMATFLLILAGSSRADLSKHPHPRLLFPTRDEAALAQRLGNDPLATALRDAVLKRSTRILNERTCRYEIPDGKRLLRESRLAIHNVTHTAMMWRLGGEEQFRLRTIAELDAACALKDWNPSHFLDTAEMAAAVAIGYDWLYPTLTAAQRTRYEQALIKKALLPAKRLHDSKGWWINGKNNWGQVCGAGIAMAAAAAWDREPALCKELFEKSVDLVERCGVFYQPEGVYPEGPSYWHYGTNYHVLLLATCQSLGQTVEVEPTLEQSGDFIIQSTGPTGYTFNFADGRSKQAVASPAQSWMARHFASATQAAQVRGAITRDLSGTAKHRYAPLHLLWLPEAPDGRAADPQTAITFRGEQPMGFFRTGWEPGASWLAIKGGTGAVSHGHLDAGAFVYEANGIRWFVDLGSDNYNMPGYFGAQRWNYFRLNNRSHNTLLIGDRLQKASKTPCPITASETRGPYDRLTLDLGPAYQGQARSVIRKAEFNHQDGTTRIEDVLVAPVAPVRWAVLTEAEVAIDGRRVTLTQDGHTLVMHREDKGGGAWTFAKATPPTSQEDQNAGFRILSFTAPVAEEMHLQVRWSPGK